YKNAPFEATKSWGNGLEVVGMEEGSKTTIFFDSKNAAISFCMSISSPFSKFLSVVTLWPTPITWTEGGTLK
ncbi:hypothetical protein KI387_025264, partial [Taxus chinensis]